MSRITQLGALALTLMLVVTASAVSAQGHISGQLTQKGAHQTLDTWRQRLSKIESLLLANKPNKAKTQAERLSHEILSRVISGEGMGEYLGTAHALRAVAAAEMGQYQEAIWQWHIGLQMFPEIAHLDLSKFGEAGQFLLDRPYHPERKTWESLLGGGGSEEDEAKLQEPLSIPAEGVTPPRKIKAPQPKFPRGKLGSGATLVILSAVIDRDGVPTQPRILKGDGEFTMVCAALDALRKWRFEPARIDGEPVEVIYNLTVNFRSGAES